MSDQFDVDVHDAEALAEIEMLANLIVATSEHDGRVPQERIDEILGVAPSQDVTGPDTSGTVASSADNPDEPAGEATQPGA